MKIIFYWNGGVYKATGSFADGEQHNVLLPNLSVVRVQHDEHGICTIRQVKLITPAGQLKRDDIKEIYSTVNGTRLGNTSKIVRIIPEKKSKATRGLTYYMLQRTDSGLYITHGDNPHTNKRRYARLFIGTYYTVKVIAQNLGFVVE